MLAYHVARALNPIGDLMTREQVMKSCGCQDMNPNEFVKMARRSGLPRIRFNKRTIRYDPLAVDAWKRHRSWG